VWQSSPKNDSLPDIAEEEIQKIALMAIGNALTPPKPDLPKERGRPVLKPDLPSERGRPARPGTRSPRGERTSLSASPAAGRAMAWRGAAAADAAERTDRGRVARPGLRESDRSSDEGKHRPNQRRSEREGLEQEPP